MSLESSIRTMIQHGAHVTLVPDARITLGFRLQDSILPAITYEVRETQLETVGTSPERSATVEIRAIDETPLSVLAIAAQIRNACASGTYGGYVFSAVIVQSHALDAPVVGEGDEMQPAESVTTILIYYTE